MALISNGSTTVSGGAVSDMTLTFTSTLVEGDVYMFEVSVLADAAVTYQLEINSDSTDANYRSGYIQSDSTKLSQSIRPESTPPSSGSFVLRGYCGLLNSEPWILCQIVEENSTKRSATWGTWNTSETAFSSLSIVVAGSNIKNDSYIKCWTLDGLTTIADVTVSGGAVTSLDTGAFTALSEGKRYFLYVGGIRNGTGTSRTHFYINNEKTAASYNGGYNGSATSTNGEGNSIVPGLRHQTTDGNIGVFVGTCGVMNSIPYIYGTTVNQGATAYHYHEGQRHTTETDFDQLVVESADSTSLADGTRILLLEFSA